MIESQIIDGQIYRDGAIVRRKFSVTLQEGMQKLEVSGLTETADTDSIRLFAPEGLSIADVQTEQLSEEMREEQTKSLVDEIKTIKDELELIELQIQLWKNNADFAKRQNIAVQDIFQYLKELPRTIKQFVEERTSITKKLEQLEKDLEKKENLLDKPILKIAVDATKSGDYTFEFTYKESDAYWKPVYEVHANSDSESLLLRLTGKVSQSTYEDWRDVSLTLFTGNPNVSANIPILKAKNVRIAEPIYINSGRKTHRSHGMMGEMHIDEDAMSVSEEVVYSPKMILEEVRVGNASSNKGETMMEYKLAGTWNIAKEQEIIVHIEEKTLPCKYHNIAVPELSSYAFLAARIENKLLEDIQNTGTSIYLDGTFVGKAIIRIDFAAESTDLSLGIDESIKVKRIQKRRSTSLQMLKGQKKCEYEYELTIASQKSKTILMTVKDRIPVSQDKSIKIESIKHEGAKFDETTGILEWEYNIAKNETKALGLSYTVAWPKDKELDYD